MLSDLFHQNKQTIKTCWVSRFYFWSLSFSRVVNLIICGLTPCSSIDHVSVKSILIPVSILLLSPPSLTIIISHHLPPPLCLTQLPLTMIMFIVCCQETENKAISKDFHQNKFSYRAEPSQKFRQTSINNMINFERGWKDVNLMQL